MSTGASFDEMRIYRYHLWREWDPTLPALLVIGLNPSTADESKDDPTIRRCIDFAKRWGFGRLDMANLFAVRSTNPKALKNKHLDPTGDPENVAAIVALAENAGRVLCAWGNHGGLRGRSAYVLGALDHLRAKLVCFGRTKLGHPEHPLYQPGAAPTQPMVVP